MIHLSNPLWWREDHVCSYHRSKGHNTENYFKLKDVIQDLIEEGKVFTDGLTKNVDHKAFKQPLPKYDKGETSKANKKNHNAKISYAYADIDNVIGMLEPIEYLCMESPSDKNQCMEEQPKVVLKTCNTPRYHGDSQSKVVL